MKKWIVLPLLAVGGWFLLSQWRPWEASGLGSEQAKGPKTAVVEPRNIEFTINAAGDIGPADQVSVRPEINGRIERLNVDIGDKVTKGQVLFTLDDKDLQTERAAQLTEIEGARLQLERAQRNFERAQQLYAEKLISQELYEDTKTNYELAKNSLERSQKSLAQVEERLTKTKIMAPFDCTILTRLVSVGQAVSGSGGFNSGTEVLTIANLNEMVINAHINQADVTRLRVGQEVEIEVEAVAGLRLRGTIERLAPQATVRNQIKGFATRIVLRNINDQVRPGMTANISIPIATADNVLAVPLSAVFTEQGERYVYLQREGKFERQPITVGLADYFFVEVREGLAAGQAVALEPPPGAMEMNQQVAAEGQTNRDRSGLRAGSASARPMIAASTNRTAGRILAGTTPTNNPARLSRPQ